MNEVFVDQAHKPLGIASDDANPNFVGASNPDSLLWVKFYSKPVQNEFKTLEQGRPIYEDRVFVTIQIPGNQLSVINTIAQEHHKLRFPLQWAHFMNTHGNEDKIVGTPLDQWSFLRPAQVEELKAVKFKTVESIAFASDLQLQSIGMIAGISPFALRDRAKVYLESANNNSIVQKQIDENRMLKQSLEEEKQARELMEAKHAREMEDLRALIQQATVRKSPGRPRNGDNAIPDPASSE